MSNSNTKRLAKNSLYMYIRMAVTMIIALYSSRVLLKTIGVEDFGIYNVVGSIISLVSMVQFFLSSSTQRFLNYEMGKKNNDRLQLIFNMSIVINVIISILFVVIVEIVGYYFFNYKINIAPDRFYAAKWVFQLSVISAVVMIMTAPYDALVIAHEKINFYAFISVLKNLLSLFIIFLVSYGSFDRLIFYAFLLLVVQLVVRLISSIYCKNNFPESLYKKCWDNKMFRDLFSFAGWQLLGTSAYNVTQSGLNLLFNVFGGPVVNAARGISYQINTAIYQFTNNVNVAITPYSIKATAEGDKDKLLRMFYFSSKSLFLITFCVSVPIIYLEEDILKLWLGTVPEYTVGFVYIVLACSLIRSVHSPLDVIFKSVGRIKQYQITEGIVLSMTLLASYILLKYGMSVYIAFSSMIFFESLNLFLIIFLADKIVGIGLKIYIKKVLLTMIVCSIVALGGYEVKNILNNYCLSFLIVIIVDLIACFYVCKFSLEEIDRSILIKIKRSVIKVF